MWEELIHDAKVRGCFFNGDEDKALENVILEVKKELNELEDFLTGDSILFKSGRWKVCCVGDFRLVVVVCLLVLCDYCPLSFGGVNMTILSVGSTCSLIVFFSTILPSGSLQ